MAAAVLLYAWVVYPAAVGLLAPRRRRRARPIEAWPLVSVIVATREADEAVRARVEDLLGTQYPADLLEIVVARDAASFEDGAWAVGRTVRFVPADPPGGKAMALNAGVRAARGEVLVFADTWQRFDPRTIPLLVEAVAQPGVLGASGSLELPGGNSLIDLYWLYERWLREREARIHSPPGATGAVYAIRRDAWRPLPAGLILDDVYVPMQIALEGGRIDFVREATARELRASTPRQEHRRKVRTLTGVLQLCAWLPRLLVPIRNPVWVQFVSHKLLRLLTPWAMLILFVWAAAALDWRSRFAWAALAAAGAAAAWLLTSRGPRGARLRSITSEMAWMQWAVLVAGSNGLRRRWDVWDG